MARRYDVVTFDCYGTLIRLGARHRGAFCGRHWRPTASVSTCPGARRVSRHRAAWWRLRPIALPRRAHRDGAGGSPPAWVAARRETGPPSWPSLPDGPPRGHQPLWSAGRGGLPARHSLERDDDLIAGTADSPPPLRPLVTATAGRPYKPRAGPLREGPGARRGTALALRPRATSTTSAGRGHWRSTTPGSTARRAPRRRWPGRPQFRDLAGLARWLAERP